MLRAAGHEGERGSERLYWQVRDGLAYSEDVRLVARPWREAGRAELTTRAVEEQLDAYVTALMDGPG
ncbi:hypothetical protein [Nonomuraea deserti]|uniref:hypothetical protein n=1 Tax=Nonomuraea deserti TaxID=1848322 RepID=UPI001C70A14B|nr:hypothetical protein [Nonomuraea deserti]